MIYYTFAQKISETYGHGDCGDEFHICPVDAYHTNSKLFYPLFESIEEAELYKSKLNSFTDLHIVSLSLFHVGKSVLMTENGVITIPNLIASYIENLNFQINKLRSELDCIKLKNIGNGSKT